MDGGLFAVLSKGIMYRYSCVYDYNSSTKRQYHLLCWWHINKNVTKNAGILLKKTFYTLATQTQDVTELASRLKKFLNDLKNDCDTKDFYEYFASFYVPKVECWAYCYRHHVSLNTNMQSCILKISIAK